MLLNCRALCDGHKDDVSWEWSCISARRTSCPRIMTGFHHLLLLLSASFVVCREDDTSSDSLLQPQFVYHDEDWLVTFLRNVTATFPHLTHLHSIGKSVQGLLADRIIFIYCWYFDNVVFCVMMGSWPVKNSCFSNFERFSYENLWGPNQRKVTCANRGLWYVSLLVLLCFSNLLGGRLPPAGTVRTAQLPSPPLLRNPSLFLCYPPRCGHHPSGTESVNPLT